MPTGGDIILAAYRDGEYVVICVADSGVGMSAEVQTHIFEPFFSTKGERGTGLGLSQVFGIVEQHRGTIAVESAPGCGSEFRLTFKAAASPVQLADTPLTDKQPRMIRRLRVLAVDDEPAMGSMVRRILRREGHSVLTATGGEEALHLLALEPFDVVISDVGMGP